MNVGPISDSAMTVLRMRKCQLYYGSCSIYVHDVIQPWPCMAWEHTSIMDHVDPSLPATAASTSTFITLVPVLEYLMLVILSLKKVEVWVLCFDPFLTLIKNVGSHQTRGVLVGSHSTSTTHVAVLEFEFARHAWAFPYLNTSPPFHALIL